MPIRRFSAGMTDFSLHDTSVQRDQPLFGFDQSGDDAQKRGLAGPAGAEKGHHFASIDLEIEVGQDSAAAERLANAGAMKGSGRWQIPVLAI